MACSGSSSTSRRSLASSRVDSGDGNFSSPIPYRKGPLDYELPVCCNCRQKHSRWISWSDANPGRRYLTYAKVQVGGCKFWRWYNPETSDFVQQLLLDLRDCVRVLRKENKEFKASASDEQAKREVLVVAKAEECANLRPNIVHAIS